VTAPSAQQPEARPDDVAMDSLRRNTGFAFASQMTSAAFTAVVTFYLVRALGPHDYGVFALAVGIGVLLVLASDLGITQSTERFIAEQGGERAGIAAVLADALKLKLVAALVACVGLAAAAGPIADAYDTPALEWPLRAIALAVLGQTTMFLFRGTFVALGRVSVAWRMVTLESAVEATATIAIVVAGAGAAGAAWGRAAGYVVGAVAGAWGAVRIAGPGALALSRAGAGGHARRIASYAGALLVVNAAFTLFDQIDVLLIGAILSASAVGFFEAPMRLVAFLGYGGQAIAFGLAPRLARRSAAAADPRSFGRALRWLVLLQAALLAPVLVWPHPMIDVALGSEYGESARVLRALAPCVFLSGIGTFVTLVVNYLGEARRRVPLAIGAVLVNLVIDLILISDIGIIGGAIGTDVAFAAYVAGHLWICRRLLGVSLRPLTVTLARSLVAAGAMAAVLAAFGTSDLSAPALVIGAACAIGAYVAALVLTRELSGAELAAARNALREPFRRRNAARRPA
jgi:O-antigen/teichoic acid export membrane protein